MTSFLTQAFGAEIQNLRSLIATHYETADDATAGALEFAAQIVDRAQAALDDADGGRTWLQLTGAIDFMSASGIAPHELAAIRVTVDNLLEAA